MSKGNKGIQEISQEAIEKIFAYERVVLSKKEIRQNPHHYQTKELLKLLAAGAVIGLSMVMPTLPMAIAPFVLDSQAFGGRRFRQQLKRLQEQKFVEIVYERGEPFVQITQRGKVQAIKYKITELQIQKPKTWNKKWHVVIFDIPEKQKQLREIFRRHLRSLGFYPLQKSVWVHPYPCFEEIEFLRQIYRIGGDVTYIVGDHLESTETLKEYFQLEE